MFARHYAAADPSKVKSEMAGELLAERYIVMLAQASICAGMRRHEPISDLSLRITMQVKIGTC